MPLTHAQKKTKFLEARQAMGKVEKLLNPKKGWPVDDDSKAAELLTELNALCGEINEIMVDLEADFLKSKAS